MSDAIKRKASLLLILLLFTAGLVILTITASSKEVPYKVAALALFALCLYKGFCEHYAFNPYYLFSLTPLSLLLYEHTFSLHYLAELGPLTYIIVLGNMAAFLAGLALLKHKIGARYRTVHTEREQSLFAPLLIVGMVPVAYGIMSAPGVFLSGDFLGMSAYVGLMPLSSVISFCRYPALALAFKSGSRRKVLIALGCCIFATVLQFNKTQLLFLLATVLVSVHRYCLNTQKSRKVFAILCGLFIAVMVFSVTFYDSIRSDFDSTEALIRTGTDSGLPRFLMLPYMYLVSSWTNLQYVIETQDWHTNGLWLLRPILFYLRIDGSFEDAYSLVAASSYNTFSFITVQWKDFGFAGSMLISLGLGLYISWLYQRFKSGRSPFMAAAYAINAVAVMEMFFSNHFFGQVYPFTITLIAILCEMIVSRNHLFDRDAKKRNDYLSNFTVQKER